MKRRERVMGGSEVKKQREREGEGEKKVNARKKVQVGMTEGSPGID